jgi:hypothetical protein
MLYEVGDECECECEGEGGSSDSLVINERKCQETGNSITLGTLTENLTLTLPEYSSCTIL